MNVRSISFNLPKINKVSFGERVTDNRTNPIGASCDVFSKKSPETKELYKKFSKETSQITAKEIEKIIKTMPDLPQETVLLAMDKLTNYSNMNSLIGLKNKFEQNNIRFIHGYEHYFENTQRKITYEVEAPIEKELLDNKIYFGDYGMELDEYYDTFNKDTVTRERSKYLADIPHGFKIPLGSVLNYLHNSSFPKRGKCPIEKGEKTALVLDRTAVELLKNEFKKNPEMFQKYNEKLLPVYIENFENTYNFLEQHKDFTKETEKLARRIESIKKTNPQMSKEKIADLILNGETLKEIKKLGFSPLIIKSENKEKPSPQTIAQKLSPSNPTKQQFDEAIEKSLKISGYENDPKAKEFLTDYLNNNLFLYSPKTLSQKLTELHQKIEQDVKAHGKPIDKIYYNVVDTNKSFGLITYMYQKANDIPPNRFIYWKGKTIGHQHETLSKMLPENSTLVFLDDNMISGSCLLSDTFPYEHSYYIGEIMKKLKNTDFIFANILTYDNVRDRLKHESKKYKRENKDRIVSIENGRMDMRDSEYFKILNKTKARIGSTAILFPYMTPDNNAPNLRELFKLYYPQESFLSNPLTEDNFTLSCY